MVAWVLNALPAQPHLRPFQPHRDLAALADLIEVAFGADLALTGSRMVRDLRQMALAGPLLRIARPVAEFMSGYVWIEGEALVGNVSVTHKGRGVWTVTNVAVQPAYRGRGIAGQLLDAAIAHVRARGGRRILLQVRTDNSVAKGLYAQRGWRRFDTWHELNLARERWSTYLGSPDTELRRVRAGDGRELYRVVVESAPPETLRQFPVAAEDYRRDALGAVARGLQAVFSGIETYELVAPRRGALAAYGRLTASLSGDPYDVFLRVVPAERSHWELRVLEGLLTVAQGLPHRDVRGYVSDSHRESIEAFERVGFRALRVLDQMVLELV